MLRVFLLLAVNLPIANLKLLTKFSDWQTPLKTKDIYFRHQASTTWHFFQRCDTYLGLHHKLQSIWGLSLKGSEGDFPSHQPTSPFPHCVTCNVLQVSELAFQSVSNLAALISSNCEARLSDCLPLSKSIICLPALIPTLIQQMCSTQTPTETLPSLARLKHMHFSRWELQVWT